MTRLFFLLVSGALAAALGCGSDSLGEESVDSGGKADGADTTGDSGVADGGTNPDANNLPDFRSCISASPPVGLPTVDWNHGVISGVTALATPHHSAQDVIAKPGAEFIIAGKFSYGSISKDLQDEIIEVWIDDCSGSYRKLGEALTDTDGRIAFVVTEPFAVGEYAAFLRVKGDDTSTYLSVRIYPTGTHFVVADIDGTLTTSDSQLTGQLFSTIFNSTNPPDARADADTLVHLRHDTQRYEMLYLSGRPYLLTNLTRQWLSDLGFSRGTVHVVDSVTQVWPSDAQVGEFKAAYLADLLAQGYLVDFAYGNAPTDIYAYASAGLAPSTTFILGTHGGEGDTVALGEDFTAHVAAVSGESAVAQPF